MVVLTALEASLRFFPGLAWTLDQANRLIAVAFVLGLTMVLVQFLWWYSERHHRLFDFLFVLCIGCGVLTILLVVRTQQFAYDERMILEIVDARKALDQRMREQAREALRASQQGREDGAADRFSQYEGDLPPEALEAIRRADQAMQERLQEARDKYMEVVAANEPSGPDQWLSFRRVDQLEEERARYMALYESALAFLEFVEGFEAEYLAALEPLDLKPPADRIAIAELQRVLQYWSSEHTVELRGLDVQIADRCLEALDILGNAWGEWYLDDTGRLQFESDLVRDRLVRVLANIDMLVREQRRIREGAGPGMR